MSEKATAERERWVYLIRMRLDGLLRGGWNDDGSPVEADLEIILWGMSNDRMFHLDRLLQAIEDQCHAPSTK